MKFKLGEKVLIQLNSGWGEGIIKFYYQSIGMYDVKITKYEKSWMIGLVVPVYEGSLKKI